MKYNNSQDKLRQLLDSPVQTPFSKPQNRTGIVEPLSAYELMQLNRQQTSPDPVISKFQKLGRGIKGLLIPETPIETLSMIPAVKGTQPVAKEILKKFNQNKFTEKGKTEFVKSFKDKSKWSGAEFIKKKGIYEGFSEIAIKPKGYKQAPYFLFYPDTYKSYQVGKKFDNVEQAINEIKGLKPHQLSGYTFEIRKGNPKKIKETELLYRDKS